MGFTDVPKSGKAMSKCKHSFEFNINNIFKLNTMQKYIFKPKAHFNTLFTINIQLAWYSMSLFLVLQMTELDRIQKFEVDNNFIELYFDEVGFNKYYGKN